VVIRDGSKEWGFKFECSRGQSSVYKAGRSVSLPSSSTSTRSYWQKQNLSNYWHSSVSSFCHSHSAPPCWAWAMNIYLPSLSPLLNFQRIASCLIWTLLSFILFANAYESYQYSVVDGTTPKPDNTREQGERILEPKILHPARTWDAEQADFSVIFN
jgi:hypothetical protein